VHLVRHIVGIDRRLRVNAERSQRLKNATESIMLRRRLTARLAVPAPEHRDFAADELGISASRVRQILKREHLLVRRRWEPEKADRLPQQPNPLHLIAQLARGLARRKVVPPPSATADQPSVKKHRP
jgi:hypothetical protein